MAFRVSGSGLGLAAGLGVGARPDEPGQQTHQANGKLVRVRCTIATAFPGDGCDFHGCRRLARLASSDREDAGLIRPADAPGSLRDVEAGAFPSSESLVPKSRIGDFRFSDDRQQLRRHLVRNQAVVRKPPCLRHARKSCKPQTNPTQTDPTPTPKPDRRPETLTLTTKRRRRESRSRTRAFDCASKCYRPTSSLPAWVRASRALRAPCSRPPGCPAWPRVQAPPAPP